MINVVIVDDHRLTAEGIASAINSTETARVTGIACSGKECRDNLVFWRPDIILLDISLPDMKGTDFCESLLKENPCLKIIGVSSHNAFSVIKHMLDSGASGYVLKNESTDVVIQAIETVLAGGFFISDETKAILNRPAHQQIHLTQREKEILWYITEGMTNAEIAEKIFLSPETIKSYRKNLLFKMDAKNTAILVKKSMELQLV